MGDVEARIVSQPENGQSLTFRILDDPSFPDGVNTLPLVFYSFNGSEVLDVQEQFSFLVPKFYTWRNANLNAHSVQKLNHFFCLDTGETYSADDFAEKVDPLTMSLGGGVCVAKNVLSPEVTAEQYYAVKPYIFFAYLGSGCYFYGAANNNNRLSNFKTSSSSALLTSGQAYGTPIILYRTLCEAEPAEKALIDKIKGGNFTNDDFSADLLDGIDLESKGSDTPDGWSNVPNGEFGAYKAPSESNHRPWAPALTSATETGGHESRNGRARDVLPAQLGGGLLGRQGQHPQVRLHRDHAPGAGQERGERPSEQCNVQCLLAANPDG